MAPETMLSVLEVIAGGVLGLFGGIVTTVIWELIIKPRRDRKSLARALRAEMNINIQVIGLTRAYIETHQRHLPSDFRLTTFVFDAFIEKAAELPDTVLDRLIWLYTRFHYHNQTKATYDEILAERNSTQEIAKRADLEKELAKTVDTLLHALDKTISDFNKLAPDLQRLSGSKRAIKSISPADLASRLNAISDDR